MVDPKENKTAWFITDMNSDRGWGRRVYWNKISKDWYFNANQGTHFETEAAAKRGDKQIGYKGIPPRKIIKGIKKGLLWFPGSAEMGALSKNTGYKTVYLLMINDRNKRYWNHNFQEWANHPDDATKYPDKHKADDVGKILSGDTGYKVETVKAFDDGAGWNIEL